MGFMGCGLGSISIRIFHCGKLSLPANESTDSARQASTSNFPFYGLNVAFIDDLDFFGPAGIGVADEYFYLFHSVFSVRLRVAG